MVRSLVIKLGMLAVTAGAVAAILHQHPAVSDGIDGDPLTPDPIIVRALPPTVGPPPTMVAASTLPTPQAAASPAANSIPPREPRGFAASVKRGAPASTLNGVKVDLNRATQQDFERLPGIGPGLARQLVEYRAAHGPYRTIDDLRAVKGIGVKRFERLVPLVTISTAPAEPRTPAVPRTETRPS